MRGKHDKKEGYDPELLDSSLQRPPWRNLKGQRSESQEQDLKELVNI